MPEYTDELPALPANTAEFTYSWKWDKEFVAATSDATYKLVLDSVKNKYEIKFISDGEQVGETQTVEYGTAATAPADPTKAPRKSILIRSTAGILRKKAATRLPISR